MEVSTEGTVRFKMYFNVFHIPLNAEYEKGKQKEREIKDDPKDLNLSNWENWAAIYQEVE